MPTRVVWGFMLENTYFTEFDPHNHKIIEDAYRQRKQKPASYFITINDSHLSDTARIYFGVVQVHLRMPGTRYYVKRKVTRRPSQSELIAYNNLFLQNVCYKDNCTCIFIQGYHGMIQLPCVFSNSNIGNNMVDHIPTTSNTMVNGTTSSNDASNNISVGSNIISNSVGTSCSINDYIDANSINISYNDINIDNSFNYDNKKFISCNFGDSNSTDDDNSTDGNSTYCNSIDSNSVISNFTNTNFSIENSTTMNLNTGDPTAMYPNIDGSTAMYAIVNNSNAMLPSTMHQTTTYPTAMNSNIVDPTAVFPINKDLTTIYTNLGNTFDCNNSLSNDFSDYLYTDDIFSNDFPTLIPMVPSQDIINLTYQNFANFQS